MPNIIPIGQVLTGKEVDADDASKPYYGCDSMCPVLYNGSSCNDFCFEFKADYYNPNYIEGDIAWETIDYQTFDTPVNVNVSGHSGDYTLKIDDYLTDGDILGGAFITYCIDDVSIITGYSPPDTNNAGYIYADRAFTYETDPSIVTNSNYTGYLDYTENFDPLDLDIYFTTREIDGDVVYSFGDRHYTTTFKRQRATVILADDDAFYHIKFKNVNTTSVTVNIRDNTNTIIFSADSNELGFDKVVQLDSGTYTVEFILNSITVTECVMEEGYEFARITDVLFRQLCTITPELWTCDQTFVGSLGSGLITEERVEYDEEVGVSYSRNSFFCLDFDDLDDGCYYFKINICSLTELFITNCFRVCDGFDGLNITWDNGIIKSGCDGTLDSNGCVFVNGSLQDFTVEDTREVYEYSTGCRTITYAKSFGVQTLQIEPIPPHLRLALTTAFMGTFYINGVEYQKLEDEDLAPLFNAKIDSPIRGLVHKVGDVIEKSNC